MDKVTHNHTSAPWRVGGQKILIDPRNGANVMTQVIETPLGEIEILDLTNEPEYNKYLIASAPKMFKALEECQKLIRIARQYFPKSVKNSNTFTLLNCDATIGKAIHEATGGQ
jgi:hypothetical protein